MYHIFFFSHKYINTTSCINIYLKEKRSNGLKKSCLGYFTFYNKNGLHYKVKIIFLIISNKDLLIECVDFCFFFFCQNKTSLIDWRGDAGLILFVVGVGGQIILHIASRWTLVSNEFEKCHAFCRLKMPSVNFNKG